MGPLFWGAGYGSWTCEDQRFPLLDMPVCRSMSLEYPHMSARVGATPGGLISLLRT